MRPIGSLHGGRERSLLFASHSRWLRACFETKRTESLHEQEPRDQARRADARALGCLKSTPANRDSCRRFAPDTACSLISAGMHFGLPSSRLVPHRLRRPVRGRPRWPRLGAGSQRQPRRLVPQGPPLRGRPDPTALPAERDPAVELPAADRVERPRQRCQPVKSAIFTPALIGLWGGRRLDRELPFAEHRPERPALLELRTYWHVRDIHEVQRARQSEQLLMSDVLYCERTGERMRAKFDRRVGKMALLCAKGCEHAPLTLEDASQLEDGLFDWLRQRGDFVNELRNPLDVDDGELRKIIKAFHWNSTAPRSVESEVRQRLGLDQTSLSLDPSAALDQAVDMMRASLVARSQRERQRAARMRQRLGQILRKRIAKVFVGTSQAAARPPEQRSYVALRFSASSAVDGVAAATRRAESAPAIRIRLQAIETSETAHVFDVPSRPQSGNTNQFLDGQHREITMTEAPCGQNTPGVRPTFSKTLGAIKGWEDVFAKIPMPGDAQPCTPMEPWFHYVSKSHGADWGIHVCACGLDSAAIALWTRLGRATCDWPVASRSQTTKASARS